MSTTEFELFQDRQRSNWVRMRTLIALRWFAVIGQTIALIVATQFFSLQIQTGPAAMTIGASIIVNLVFRFIYPENKRLVEREAFGMLIFDITQLGLLLYLTGGLNNPFAMLMLAPVTIAATVLHLSSTLLLGGAAIAITTALSQFSLPIATKSGSLLVLPQLFQFGFWLAIVIGVIFLAIYARQVTNEMHNMGEALLATQLALSREQKLTDLGGVVAATAHELGSPLATIMLVSGELRSDLADKSDALEDVNLIYEQAVRCRDILQSMGAAGKDDKHMQQAPIEALVREAAMPHISRGKRVAFRVRADADSNMNHPIVMRRPEIIHGLRNLIQNAVDFAVTSVEITVTWSDQEVRVQVRDDGTGFPTSIIGRIGDPFVRRRSNEDDARRPGYSGMGLGLFIAKTLLERSGARLLFHNAPRNAQRSGGAIVKVTWPLEAISLPPGTPLGDNQMFATY